MERGSFSLTVRVIAGAYIAYLGYKLISGYINPTDETGEPGWYILLIGIVFVVLGVFFIVDAIRKQVQARREAEEEDSDESAEEGADALEEKDASQETSDEDEYVPPQTMTIAERIRRLSAVDEDDDEEKEE